MTLRLTLLAAGAAFASSAPAGIVHDTDIIVEVREGAITTNRVDGSGMTTPERVFDADAISFFGNIVTDDPGFNAPIGGLPPFAVLSIDLVAPLKVWTGAGFEIVPAARFLEIDLNNQTAQSPPSEGVEVTGPLMNATEFGDLHKHAEHFLFVDAEPGIYLGSFRLSSASASDSESFFFVYRWEPNSGDIVGAEAEQQAAIAWLRDELAGSDCPTDFDGDGATGSTDLGVLLAAWGQAGADLDGDGVTGSGDLGALLAAWGACP